MSVPGPVQLDLGDIRELHLGDLRPSSDGAATGTTECGQFRLEVFAPGIVRLRIGTSTLPDYGLLVERPAGTAARLPWKARAGVLVLRAGELTATIDSGQFTVTLARNGQTLLGPPRDAHFRRRFRLPRFAARAAGLGGRHRPGRGRAGLRPWREMEPARPSRAAARLLERGRARGQCRDRLQELPLRLEPARLGAVRQHAGTGGARRRLSPPGRTAPTCSRSRTRRSISS